MSPETNPNQRFGRKNIDEIRCHGDENFGTASSGTIHPGRDALIRVFIVMLENLALTATPSNLRIIPRFALTLFLTLLPPSSFSADELTQIEWDGLPTHCKASFLNSSYGNLAPLHQTLNKSWAENFLGMSSKDIDIPGVHHFCMGIVHLNRAKIRPQSIVAAESEFAYSYKRISVTAKKFALVSAYYGKSLYLKGDRTKAMEIWEKAISAKPSNPEPYLSMAEALLSEKKPKDALDTIFRYYPKLDSDHAETEYLLAFIYLELDMIPESRQHADKAKKLGRPMPGLREKPEKQDSEKPSKTHKSQHDKFWNIT